MTKIFFITKEQIELLKPVDGKSDPIKVDVALDEIVENQSLGEIRAGEKVAIVKDGEVKMVENTKTFTKDDHGRWVCPICESHDNVWECEELCYCRHCDYDGWQKTSNKPTEPAPKHSELSGTQLVINGKTFNLPEPVFREFGRTRELIESQHNELIPLREMLLEKIKKINTEKRSPLVEDYLKKILKFPMFDENKNPQCRICGKKFIPVKDSKTGEFSGHTWKGGCEHFPDGVRMCILGTGRTEKEAPEEPITYKIGDMVKVHGEDAPCKIIGTHGGSFAFRDRYGRNLIRPLPFIVEKADKEITQTLSKEKYGETQKINSDIHAFKVMRQEVKGSLDNQLFEIDNKIRAFESRKMRIFADEKNWVDE